MRVCANSTPLQDRQPAAAWFKVLNMHGSTHLSTWVSAETKQRFGELARQAGISESSLLRRMVELTLHGTQVAEAGAFLSSPAKVSRDARLYVRLRPEDHLLLRERASGRGIAAATYVSMLVRAHLRAVVPIPDLELAEIKRSVAALGVVGRNLNQIARVANQTGIANGPSVADLWQLLKACEALRSHTKALLSANVASWESGHAETAR